MRRPLLSLASLLLAVSAPATAQKAAPRGTRQDAPATPDPAIWEMTFADDFSAAPAGTGPDLTKWTLHDPWGTARPRELQGYAPDAAQRTPGLLRLTASRAAVAYDGRTRDYRSGIVSTFGLFSQAFGRFEIRCRIAAGAGLASSLRLLPVPLAQLPEIDVFAASGGEPSKVHFAHQWGNEQTTRSFYDSYPAPDLSAGFHTFAVEWDKTSIAWFLDGKLTMRSTEGVPQQAMFLVADLAVGGVLAGVPDERTSFPASFDIEYIRVYRRR